MDFTTVLIARVGVEGSLDGSSLILPLLLVDHQVRGGSLVKVLLNGASGSLDPACDLCDAPVVGLGLPGGDGEADADAAVVEDFADHGC